jgi:hypothetical protein
VGSDFDNLPPHVLAQLEAQGQNLANAGVEEAPTQSVAPEQGQDIAQLPTDWSQKPGGDVPEPAQVEQIPTETQSITPER